MLQIPQNGKTKEEIFQTLKSYKGDDLDWKSGTSSTRLTPCICLKTRWTR
jgi:hypothetical protein